MDVIIPTNLVYVLFDPAIPTSSFNFIQLFLYLCKVQSISLITHPQDNYSMSHVTVLYIRLRSILIVLLFSACDRELDMVRTRIHTPLILNVIKNITSNSGGTS